MADSTRIIVCEDATERAAAELADALSAAAAPRLAIPGGSALSAVELAVRRIPEKWHDVLLTWVDERCVDVDDVESNRGAAYRAGIQAGGNERELPLYLDGEEPEQALARIAAVFERDFGSALDVVLLGMGPDGHVASLFPGREWNGGVAAFVPDSPKPPPRRITLTRSTLATARVTILLATGEAKRDALARLVSGDTTLPAHGLPGLIVVTDQNIA